jgi:hypothetical protein
VSSSSKSKIESVVKNSADFVSISDFEIPAWKVHKEIFRLPVLSFLREGNNSFLMHTDFLHSEIKGFMMPRCDFKKGDFLEKSEKIAKSDNKNVLMKRDQFYESDRKFLLPKSKFNKKSCEPRLRVLSEASFNTAFKVPKPPKNSKNETSVKNANSDAKSSRKSQIKNTVKFKDFKLLKPAFRFPKFDKSFKLDDKSEVSLEVVTVESKPSISIISSRSSEYSKSSKNSTRLSQEDFLPVNYEVKPVDFFSFGVNRRNFRIPHSLYPTKVEIVPENFATEVPVKMEVGVQSVLKITKSQQQKSPKISSKKSAQKSVQKTVENPSQTSSKPSHAASRNIGNNIYGFIDQKTLKIDQTTVKIPKFEARSETPPSATIPTQPNKAWSQMSCSGLSISVSMIGAKKVIKPRHALPEGQQWISQQNFGTVTRSSFAVPVSEISRHDFYDEDEIDEKVKRLLSGDLEDDGEVLKTGYEPVGVENFPFTGKWSFRVPKNDNRS